jgi:hypothetical protein
MSFRAAQDHNKTTGQVMTSSTAYSTQREDPTAMTRRRRSCQTCLACHELYCLKVVKLVLLLLIINYVVDLMMCVNYIGVVYDLIMYSLPVLETPHLGRQGKQAVVKNRTLICIG